MRLAVLALLLGIAGALQAQSFPVAGNERWGEVIRDVGVRLD